MFNSRLGKNCDLIAKNNLASIFLANQIRIGKAERPRESILSGQAFVGACTAGSDGYNQVKLHVAITLHMIIYPQYMGLVDILI
jgi:hypothetical protein